MKISEMTREQLESVAEKYKIRFDSDTSEDELRMLIRKARDVAKAAADNMVDVKSKEERIIDFIKSMVSIDNAITPYREQRKDLKKDYDDNMWLSRKEQKMVLTAHKMLQDKEDMEQLQKLYEQISKMFGSSAD